MAKEAKVPQSYQSLQRPGYKDKGDIKIRGVIESLVGSNLLLGILK